MYHFHIITCNEKVKLARLQLTPRDKSRCHRCLWHDLHNFASRRSHFSQIIDGDLVCSSYGNSNLRILKVACLKAKSQFLLPPSCALTLSLSLFFFCRRRRKVQANMAVSNYSIGSSVQLSNTSIRCGTFHFVFFAVANVSYEPLILFSWLPFRLICGLN